MDPEKIDNPSFLVEDWLRAVPGLTERLARGINVADIGCGWGASTVTMAAAFPRSRFLGIEPNVVSIQGARRLATARGLHNVYWLPAPVHQLTPRPSHDLICAFNCIHDLVDPRAAVRTIHSALADDGVYIWSTRTEGAVRELAKHAGFSRVEKLPVDDAFNLLFALGK
ncbi:MAG TPA: class I SAM-dependent methyltransferase [Methylomirabilota bacterium]|jgi:trans-aconitate methyltransferase